MNENIKGIITVILFALIFGFTTEWLSIPWKIDKTNKLLQEILDKINKEIK